MTTEPFDLSAAKASSCDGCVPSESTLAGLSEREHERALFAAVAEAGFVLVKRFGWTRERLTASLDYELREQLTDCAQDDAEFRAWYANWLRDNPQPGDEPCR